MTILNWNTVVAIGILLRLLTSTNGNNFDLESWKLVADAILRGENYWIATNRWQYGPVVPPFLGAARAISNTLSSTVNFHFCVVFFLCLVDLAIALLLRRRFGESAGKLFLLNPGGILLTGYHSQIDNVAILFAFMSMLTLERVKQSASSTLILSGLLFSLSILSKHILFALPIWILLGTARLSCRQQTIWCATAGCGVLVVLLPCVFQAEIWRGFKENVLYYNPTNVFQTDSPLALVSEIIELSFDGRIALTSSTALGACFLCLCGVVISGHKRNASPAILFANFLLAVTFAAPTLADQYLAMGLFAACALSGVVSPLWMLGLINLRLLFSPFNVLRSFFLFPNPPYISPTLFLTWSAVGTIVQIVAFGYLIQSFRRFRSS